MQHAAKECKIPWWQDEILSELVLSMDDENAESQENYDASMGEMNQVERNLDSIPYRRLPPQS